MIRVTLELCKWGDCSQPKHLGTAFISNDGTGTGGTGNYNVRLSKWEGREGQTWRKGRVEGFPRIKLGAYDLLYRALKETVGDRNP